MKQKTKKLNPLRPAAQGALLAALVVLLACTEDQAQEMSRSDETFEIVEDLAQYPGGNEALYDYIGNEIIYPKEARTQGIEGRLFVEFVVEKDGSVSNVKTVKGIGGGCDEEAERVIRSAANFKPAHQRGKKVRVRMVVPITFQLDKEKTNSDGSPQGIIILSELRLVENNMMVKAFNANGVWKGTVYDENGNEMPGANIVVVGSTSGMVSDTNGTVSDLDGSFTLTARESDEILVSFVGYKAVKLGSASR